VLVRMLALVLLATGTVQAQQHAHYSGVARPAQIAPRPVKPQVTAPKAVVSLGGKPVPVTRGRR
jgi:hypothetical protein